MNIYNKAILFFYVFIISNLFIVHTQKVRDIKCCSSYDTTHSYCQGCPSGTYYSANNCVIDIENFLQYTDCFSCAVCASGYKLVDTKVNELDTKKCQLAGIFKQINLANTDESGIEGQTFMISDDYMRSFHTEIQKAKTLSALHIKHQNGTQSLVIQYTVPGDKKEQDLYYRAIINVDLVTFIFVEVSFGKIGKLQLRPKGTYQIKFNINLQKNKVIQLDITKSVGTMTQYNDYSQRDINLFANQNQGLLTAADFIAQGPKSIYKGLKSVKILYYKNNTQFIELNYHKADLTTQSIVIDVNTKKVVRINGVNVLQNNKVNNLGASKQVKNQNVTNLNTTNNNQNGSLTNLSSPTNTNGTQTQAQITKIQIVNSNSTNQNTTDGKQNQTSNSAPIPSSNPTNNFTIPSPTNINSTTNPNQTQTPAFIPISSPIFTQIRTNQTSAPINTNQSSTQPLSPPINTNVTSTSTTPTSTPTPTPILTQINTNITPNNTNSTSASTSTSNSTSPPNINTPATPISTNTAPQDPTPTPTNTTLNPNNTTLTNSNTTTTLPQSIIVPSFDSSTGLWKPSSTSGYQQQTLSNSLRDINFLVAKDLLNRQLSGYIQILPQLSYTKSFNNIVSYILIFDKSDGFKYQVSLQVNNISKIPQFIYQRKIGNAPPSTQPNTSTSTSSRIYTTKPKSTVIKNQYFLYAAVQMSK